MSANKVLNLNLKSTQHLPNDVFCPCLAVNITIRGGHLTPALVKTVATSSGVMYSGVLKKWSVRDGSRIRLREATITFRKRLLGSSLGRGEGDKT